MMAESSWNEPDCIYLTAGTATGGTALNAFDNALRDAGIDDFNLIDVSSVVPAGTPIRFLPANSRIPANGRFVPVVYSDIRSNDIGSPIAAAIGIGKPSDTNSAGVIFEYSCHDEEEVAVAKVREMIREGMNRRNIEIFDVETISSSITIESEFTAVVTAALMCDADVMALIQAAGQQE